MTELDVLLRSLAALAGGAIIGLERSYRGRAAGLRTYALVAFGASLIAASAGYAAGWARAGQGDPTRVVQGIVTGIGFLGAGVILKEGFSVRGLTTAASIWVVAGIGVLFGLGLFGAGTGATAATWATLELLRQLENRLPTHSLVHCELEFARGASWSEERVRDFAKAHAFEISELSYALDYSSQTISFELVMWSQDARAPGRLAQVLAGSTDIVGFGIRPARD